MSIVHLQRRIQEVGRLRIGQLVQSGNGTRPAKLDTIRATSPDHQRVQQVANLYGGTVTEWRAPSGRQWEVVTEVDSLDVIVPPSEMAFSQHFELWSAGGAQRRCDGVTESLTQQGCLCDPDARECSIHTRLSVMLQDVPGIGVWRLDTQGWYAALELNGAVELLQAAASRGALLPARLRLEQRSVKRQRDGKSETRRFAVPMLDVDITPAQLLGGQAPTANLDTGPPERAAGDTPASFTPVPAELPTGPGQSIAEQSAPPPPKPKRANAAPEIPDSGRKRSGKTPEPVPEPGDDPEQISLDEAQHSDPDAPIDDGLRRHLFALIGKFGFADDRDERLSVLSTLVNQPLSSAKELTVKQASGVIDLLERMLQHDDAQQRLDLVLAEMRDEKPRE